MYDQSAPPRAFALDREVIVATGPEAAPFLQGQLSQDVLALVDRAFSWSWLLAPNGKVDALLRITRVSEQEWWLDTDAGWGPRVLERLARFKLRTKVDLAHSALTVVGLRGSGWDLSGASTPLPGMVLAPPWPGLDGGDVLCSEADAAAFPVEPPEAYEPVRIAAGIPRMGAELDDRTIPAETGLVAMTASFTKGCYTGQELVARIDSRGSNVARHLRRLRLDEPEGGGPVPGDELFDADGRSVGHITSAATTPDGRWVGLGYVRRGVEPSAPLSAGAQGAPVSQAEVAC